MRAYCYLIGWTEQDKYYYGVRYAKNCSVDDLWNTYFTSSKHVKNFSSKYGKPDVIEIRNTFDTVEKSWAWENTVIRRMNIVESKRFLNATNNVAIPVVEFNRAKNFRNDDPTRKRWNDLTTEQQENIRETSRKVLTERHKSGLMTYEKPEDTTNYVNASNKRWSNKEYRKKQSGRKWMHKDKQSKMITNDNFSSYISMGWALGRGG
jgi:hypothetical protein